VCRIQEYAMSDALKLVLIALLGGSACSSQVTGGSMSISLQSMSNVDATGIQDIALYLYGMDCTTPAATCDALLHKGISPRGLGQARESAARAGEYVHVDLSELSGCAMLYIEAYAGPMWPSQVLAAGCSDLTLPDQGNIPVVVNMISVTDADMDGWIGQFNFEDGTQAQGPDCNDSDYHVNPSAIEDACTGDRNCDGTSVCSRECQSNADCVGKAGGPCCNLTSFACEQCPQQSCATSSECTSGCCQRQDTTGSCVSPGNDVCQCITTTECNVLGASACCVSNQNTSSQLTPGSCTDIKTYLQTHQTFRTEWCRCESSGACDALFPQFAAQICCIQSRRVCDSPGTNERCLPQ